jgi:hypothetical protein
VRAAARTRERAMLEIAAARVLIGDSIEREEIEF